MLNLTPIRGSNQYAAAHYFSAVDDYYIKEAAGEAPADGKKLPAAGLWHGRGAAALGLSGPVQQAQLARLLNGQLPGGIRIAATFDASANKKRMGLDMTFSAPKSVSLQALVGGDVRVAAAHDQAVARALNQVERLAETRKKIQGKSGRERTGNMVIAAFRHELSRANDPQLHTHAIVLNMTQRSDGAWRALANEDLFRVQHEIDAVYKAELAHGLTELGYGIRLLDDKGNFELAHISRHQIEAFSKRGQAIEHTLADVGKTRHTAHALEKQAIALASRPAKHRLTSGERAELKREWVALSRELDIAYASPLSFPGQRESGQPLPEHGSRGNNIGHAAVSGDGEDPAAAPSHATHADTQFRLSTVQVIVRYAVAHLTEREAVVSETNLLTTAMRRAVGLASPEEVRAEVARLVAQGTLIASTPTYVGAAGGATVPRTALGWQHDLAITKGWSRARAKRYVEHAIGAGSLVPELKRYTTQAALKREKAILAIERDGRASMTPLLTEAILRQVLQLSPLNTGQRDAVATMIGSPHRFVGIQGDAGTGKTFTVRQAVALVHACAAVRTAVRTLVLAPYGNQVKALKQEGLDAHTLASFIRAKNKDIDRHTLVILDEAAVVGARQMEQVMRIVERAGARMVMLGDTKQTAAIEAGKPFAQLQMHGMQTARVHEILRQKAPELKAAVEHAAAGRPVASLAHIAHVEEFESTNQRLHGLVHDYMDLGTGARQDCLIVVGTNHARRQVNGLVREAMGLAETGRHFDTLVRADLTQAQRRFAPSYQPGMVVQPERDYPKMGLLRGQSYLVKESLPGNLLHLERFHPGASDMALVVNPRVATQLSVYHLEKTELAVGDLVRINRNQAALDLTNGDRFWVTSTAGGVLTLASRTEMPQATQAAFSAMQPLGSGPSPVRTLALSGSQMLHLEHAYASTVHSAQGLSCERVFISLDTKSRTTSQNLYYVAISRARTEARVYTNDIDQLPHAIARRVDKQSALALQQERARQDHTQVQRNLKQDGFEKLRRDLGERSARHSKE